MNHQEILTNYVSAFIQQLINGGVTKAVISPGSRSTPLAYLLEDHPLIDCHVNVDERSAAFYALGMAKASGRPVVLVCTSGTAAANYFPAVVEAHYARVPLLVLTADRPHELREVGAPQAIDQLHLFGRHVKWFADMALPEESPAVLKHVTRTAARAAAKTLEAPMGPVHLNFPFREPLSPILGQWSMDAVPQTISHFKGNKELPDSAAVSLSKKVNEISRGIIIVGPMSNDRGNEAILKFAKASGFPVLADPLSHLRKELSKEDLLIEGYDAFLKGEDAKAKLQPDLIIRFGGMPVSKPLLQFLSPLTEASHWLIDQGTDWRDPLSSVTDYIDSEEVSFVEGLLPFLKEKENQDWTESWKRVNQAAIEQIAQHIQEEKDEGAVVGQLLQALPENSHVVVGNSMPIRDVDTFLTRSASPLTVWANRGANGIDGVVSTALGIAVETKDPVYLLIGDLSMFHDMNGLLVSKQYPVNLHIIVINNNGGGIFSFLPQAQEPKHFETLFGTPPALDFTHAAKLYSLDYQKIESVEGVTAGIQSLHDQQGVTMTEILTNREENVRVHRELWKKVQNAVSGVLS
ncbi:2-succinyl-5-enolpyruvyl-6-hydroxy-3-cyclohexene-1-carboxylic-acid synthase [Jeotgalibacillus proteolyticus]|uniref:2-succinyl-5-enolpyruvyl-6-hydroxy-3-cyclohexene-1-carboxylate synthase n=1 Tax=Jeotgalibacillus proteolyticus TaxID=2082395 RepID=A0A2S5GFS3_9BACL|nr:2-succinyl-5-enolpyruvyl-6-hydroxy-3-cyclohexene-1-carboxylic-acid synthase [Jeotgalibacillus proteolyticus]PPA71754.1 2-succinyl-5-enolpyruvyl-6-hydroxy-3-cyclohexene-1-carboxylic-acid synthase [Jeotgalibacillus proteolyticus]